MSRSWGVSRQRKERNAGHIEAPLPEGTRPNTTGRVRSNSETRVVVRMGPKQSKQLPSAGKSAGFGPRRFPGEDADRLGGVPDQGRGGEHRRRAGGRRWSRGRTPSCCRSGCRRRSGSCGSRGAGSGRCGAAGCRAAPRCGCRRSGSRPCRQAAWGGTAVEMHRRRYWGRGKRDTHPQKNTAKIQLLQKSREIYRFCQKEK